MTCAIKDNISEGAKIALVNTMALIDREREQVRFTEFKAAFKQTFSTTPSSDTFYGKNFSGNYDYDNKEHRNRSPRSRSRDRNAGRSRDFQQRNKSPNRPRQDSAHFPAFRDTNRRQTHYVTDREDESRPESDHC